MDTEKSLNLNRLALYAAGEEITRGTFNKIKIGEELFPRVKPEPLEDVVSESYKVGSQADPNVNSDSPFANYQEKKVTQHLKKASGSAAAAPSTPAQRKLPHRQNQEAYISFKA